MKTCNKCRLHLHRTQVVLGDGREENPLLFIIGEAPGKTEDEEGKPFVGGSGKVLRGVLYSLKIDPEQCYITNVCKCRPPDNRTPEFDEVEACLPYLIDEIEKIKPKRILLLGETACIAFGITQPISQVRGTVFEKEFSTFKSKVLATYHPSFVMRAREHFATFSWDINKLLVTEDVDDGSEVEYLFNPSREIIEQYLFEAVKTDFPVAVDIETFGDDDDDDSGLNPFKDEIIGISFTSRKGTALQLSGQTLKDNWGLVKEFLESCNNLIFQNNLFDRTFLWVKGAKVKNIKWDTQTGMHLINSSLPKKLDFLRTLYTNIPSYKNKENYKYNLNWLNARDTDITWRVAQEQKKYVSQSLMDRWLQYDNVALHMKLQGVTIDQEVLAKHYLIYHPLESKLLEEFGKEYGIDINSPKQLSEFLYKKLNLYPSGSPKQGKKFLSTDEDTLKNLRDTYVYDENISAILNKILQYREVKTIVSKYCEGLYKLIQEDGKVHPEWRTVGTDTGRWACKKPNMQNFPKHMRDVVVPDSPDYVLIGADYNRIELYVAAVISQDYEMLEILEKDDIHQRVLEAIEEVYPLTEKVGKDQARLRAKALVFGTLYGRSAHSIAQEFKVPRSTAQQWQNAFLRRFEKLRKFFEEDLVNFFNKHGYTQTFFGFRKYTEKLPEAKNHVIQGTAAEIMKRAGLKLIEKGFDVRISVHDQWVCQVRKDEAEEKFKEFIEIMETAVPELHNRFPAEGKIGNNWKEV